MHGPKYIKKYVKIFEVFDAEFLSGGKIHTLFTLN